jgi:hypothetical protein
MLNHMKSLTIEEMIFNLYEESCKYVANRIVSSAGKDRFYTTTLVVKNILKNKLDPSLLPESFVSTTRNLNKTKDQITRAYHFKSTLELMLFNPKQYDEMAFDIAFDLLNKIKTRFYDGYVG